MTPEQMKIAFEQKYQKKAQNRARGLTSGEVDYWLNEGQDVLVDEIVNGRPPERAYSKRDKRIADLRNLRKTKYIPSTNTPEQHTVHGRLPEDYRYLDGPAIKINYVDKNTTCNYTTSVVINYIKEFVVVLPFEFKASYFTNPDNNKVTLRIGDQDIISTNKFNFSDIKDDNDSAIIIEPLLEILSRNNDYEAYWETYRDKYYPNSFIIVTMNPTKATSDSAYVHTTEPETINPGSLGTTDNNFKGLDAYLTIGSFQSNDKLKQITYNNFWITPSLNPVTRYVHEKDTDPSKIERHRRHPFKRSNLYSILTDVKDGVIVGYGNDEFLITEFKLNYVKIPRRINNFTGISCELPEDMHREVVDIAVSRLLQAVGSQRYQTKLTDNQISNNN